MSWISSRVIRGNRGDIASRFGILMAFQECGAGLNSIFASRDSHVPSSLSASILPYGKLYNLWPGFKGLSALKASKYVVWTGGLDLQDDSSLIKLIHTWLVFLSYRLLGLKILLAHQGAGPLQTKTGRWLARRVLSCVELALVRDRGSHKLLTQLMPAERLRLAADGIFLEGFPMRGEQLTLPSTIVPLVMTGRRPLIGLNVRLWFHFTSSWIPYQFARERYLKRAEAPMHALMESLGAVVRHLRERHDARVVLVSMYEPGIEPWEDDLPLLEQLKANFGDDDEILVLKEDLRIEDLCKLFANFDLMIGTRLHSTLIALRAGVPAIHVSYTLKGRDIYTDLGLSDWVIDIEELMHSPTSLLSRIDALQADSSRFERVRLTVEPLIKRNQAALEDAIRSVEVN